MEPPTPTSPSLPSTSSSPLHDYVCSKEDPADDPPSAFSLYIQRVPKWVCDTTNVTRLMTRDPFHSHHTHDHISSIELLNHAILDGPKSFS